jgi:hypothetical protein
VGGFAHRDGGVGGIEKVDKLMMPMSLHAEVDYRPIRHIEGGEQRRGACFVGHDFAVVRCQEHDPCPSDTLSRAVPIRHDANGVIRSHSVTSMVEYPRKPRTGDRQIISLSKV